MRYARRLPSIVLVIGLFCACNGSSSPKTLQDLLHQAGLEFHNSEHFRIAEQFIRQRQGASVLSAETRNGDTVIKIELIKNIDPDAARAFIDERKYTILSLYQSYGSAYPGAITNTVSIPEALKPEVVDINLDKIETPVYLLWSNSRFNYGVTRDDLVHYGAALVFFYHPEKRVLIRLDLFMPKTQFERHKVLDWLGTLAFSAATPTNSGSRSLSAQGVSPEPSPLSAEPTQAEKRPRFNGYNLILIGFEPLGASHVSAYGYARHTTPRLDRFAQDAYLFEQAISPSSWTLPVFMSWFTGMYPSQHGIVNKYRIAKNGQDILSNLNDLAPSVVTLAQVLRRHGYQTAGFTGGAALSQDFGFAKGFDTYDGGASFGGFDRTLPLALKWLQENGTRKFFLFVQGFDVHGRFPLPEGGDNPFLADNDAARVDGAPDAYWQLRNLSIENEPLNLSEEQRQFWINTYDAKIFEADKRFGEFIDALAVMRLIEKTIVIISSGSGNEYGEHKRFDHGFSLYDELIRVPLIIRIPETIGGVIKAQVRTLDMMPTIMDLLALQTDETLKHQMQGISIWPLITGVPMQLEAFAETDYLLQAFKRCLRTADGWKYIYSLDSEARELYHLSQDPEEKSNLIGKEAPMAYKLEQRLFKHLNGLKSDSAP